MRRGSRRAVLVALVLPGALSLLTAGTLLFLIPQAPEAIVMQWSGGAPSRHAPPSELFFLPVIALAVSIFLWAITPTDKARSARLGLTTGNGVNGVLNASAVTLLAGQLEGAATGALPVGALALALVVGVVVAFTTFLWT